MPTTTKLLLWRAVPTLFVSLLLFPHSRDSLGPVADENDGGDKKGVEVIELSAKWVSVTRSTSLSAPLSAQTRDCLLSRAVSGDDKSDDEDKFDDDVKFSRRCRKEG